MKFFECKIVIIKTCVFGAPKNDLFEAVLLSTRIKCLVEK